MTNTLPYSYTVELSSLSEAGRDVDLSVPEGACREIASFYEVDGIEDFTAQFHLSRLAKNEYMLEGHFVARVLQTCIVTLGPIQTSLEQDFTRR